LLAGASVVIWIGFARLNVAPVGEALAVGDLLALGTALRAVFNAPDAWLWLYLTFAISNSMLPSASDRRAWPVLLVVTLVLGGILFYAGLGPTLVNALARPLDNALRALAVVFSITIVLDLALAPFIWLIEMGLTRMTGWKVEY
jgi:Na+/H+ antiporter NhaC